MDKLPQRDDLIYKEIEEFQDYELTNCIAYEMAIRNKEASRKLAILKRIKTLKYNIIEKIRAKSNNYYSSYRKYPIIFKDIMEEILIYRLKREFGINYNYSEIEENPIGIKFVRNTSLYSEAMREQLLSLLDKKLKYKTKTNFITKGGYLIEQIYNKKMEIKSEINSNFKRKLTLKNELNIKIDLPLNLPKEELLAYISKIKDDFDKDNSIIKTPLELLGEILENENIDIKNLPKRDIKKIYADMFFIYDYFIFQDKKYKNEREKLKNELKIEIKKINKKWDYDKSGKKAEIEEQKNDYKTNKKQYSKEQIIDELVEELKFKKTKVNDYLKIMRIFIDDLEYKKLLTGGLKLY
ncbi:hypothetical protein [Aliarcobacter butzleri]|uniref:hypothetical protein n=3 Tax=Aliarcobacter butzleri TaxID=28197 RepID=UPI000229578B|nr:hypothetical protein [Aliarcobacter butzleri]BAK70566.1 hypothetical protein ABED_0849 [Aliarcobacter butzleri ED-1]